MSSGFSEMGAEGHAAQLQLEMIARESGMGIHGANCPALFVMSERRAISFSPRLDALVVLADKTKNARMEDA